MLWTLSLNYSENLSEYLFLCTKLRSLWRTGSKFEMMDLGLDFYKVSFQNKEDLDAVLKRTLVY